MNDFNITTLQHTEDFKLRVKQFQSEWYNFYDNISQTDTPPYDGRGEEIIKRRLDGKLYVEDKWIRDRLDFYFPGWSWESASPLHFLGSEWVVAQGHLIILDYHLIQFNINPPYRKFYGCDAVRIQYKQGQPHEPQNIIDIGDNCQSANTGALKRAANRLCHICDDIYGKRVESDGSGTLDDIIIKSNNKDAFVTWINERKLSWNTVYEILNVNGLSEIEDCKHAMQSIKMAKGWE